MPSPLAILDRVRRPAGLYELKVTLLETDPPIWRRIVVPADTTLGGTHRILQAVMGWMNSHLHVFTAGSVDYSEPGAEWDIPVRDERDVPLSQIARAAGDAFVYEYDLGDSWEHLITLEKIAPLEPWARWPYASGVSWQARSRIREACAVTTRSSRSFALLSTQSTKKRRTGSKAWPSSWDGRSSIPRPSTWRSSTPRCAACDESGRAAARRDGWMRGRKGSRLRSGGLPPSVFDPETMPDPIRPRLLVVSDDPETGTIVRDVLGARGYAAQYVTNAQATLPRLTAFHPALVVLDMFTPLLHEWPILDGLLRLSHAPPIVALTGRCLSPDALAAVTFHGRGHLQKPFEPAALLRLCGRMVARQGLRRVCRNDAPTSDNTSQVTPPWSRRRGARPSFFRCST